MDKIKIGLGYWDKRMVPPDEHDAAAIHEAFGRENTFNNDEKVLLAELLLASRMRVMDEETGDVLYKITTLFNKEFAVEELFYTESSFMFCTWRYSYKVFVKAIPKRWAVIAIKNIYARMGIDLDSADIEKIYDSDNLYKAFFKFIADELGDSKYIYAGKDIKLWNSFAFVAYFNMWHLFGVLGFNGYSPYIVCADLGILSPPCSAWQYAVLTLTQKATIDEIKTRSRGRSYPTWHQNRFMGVLAEL